MSSKAVKAGRRLRNKLELNGSVDVEAVAEGLGLRVVYWPLAGRINEVKFGKFIGVNESLCPAKRRFAIAHAIGHHLLHPGNQIWLRAETLLEVASERQPEDFA